MVLGDLDPSDLRHVRSRLIKPRGRAHDPVHGEVDIRRVGEPPRARLRIPGRVGDQYPRLDNLDDHCPIQILEAHMGAPHPGAKALQFFHRLCLIPCRTREAVAQEHRLPIEAVGHLPPQP